MSYKRIVCSLVNSVPVCALTVKAEIFLFYFVQQANLSNPATSRYLQLYVMQKLAKGDLLVIIIKQSVLCFMTC